MQQVSSTSSLINNYRTEDPRSPLQKLNRKQLRAFCKHHGIPYTVAMPATALRELVQGSGYDGTQPYVYPIPREDPPEIVVAESKVTMVGENWQPSFELPPEVQRLSPPQLKKICKERGIKTLADGSPITNKAKKVELLQALLAKPLVSSTVPQMGFDDG